MTEPTDEELMERFCKGDERAFDALFARHAGPVHAFLTRMVGDSAQAEDLLQITFLSVVRSRDRFDRTARVAPWLFSIAANAARDALRRKVRSHEEQSTMHEVEVETHATLPDPGLAREIDAALAALPLPQREAVVMHRFLGWTFEEMAEALGTNATTIRVRAHRGSEKLRELLGHLWEGA